MDQMRHDLRVQGGAGDGIQFRVRLRVGGEVP
jgi:hypothetical protein